MLRRREFLASCGLATLAPGALASAAASALQPPKRPKVAVLITTFFPRSHAHVLLENFTEPYLFNGQKILPEFDVAAMYVEQKHADDMAPQVSKDYGIPIFPSIREALTLGGDRLAVDAILSIGEHGDYPVNSKGQTEYPRKRFFDEAVAVFRASGRGVPFFNDKHLSYRWDWAKAMYDEAKSFPFPLMAGSSVPLAERVPPLELPPNPELVEAVSIHGGPLEGYDFHGLEVLQSIVEARKGGESGIRSVRLLKGDALWKAAEDGHWAPHLADAALAAELGPDAPSVKDFAAKESLKVHGILLDYADGLRGTVLALPGKGNRWNFAALVRGEPTPHATHFYGGPWNNRNLFRALAHAIQQFFRTGTSPYPIERTLLTTGALDAAMTSRAEGGKSVDTPQLAIAYRPIDFGAVREMGKTWDFIPEGTPEPKGFDTHLRG